MNMPQETNGLEEFWAYVVVGIVFAFFFWQFIIWSEKSESLSCEDRVVGTNYPPYECINSDEHKMCLLIINGGIQTNYLPARCLKYAK